MCNIIYKTTKIQGEIKGIYIVVRFLNSILSGQILILKRVCKVVCSLRPKETNNLGMVAYNTIPALRRQRQETHELKPVLHSENYLKKI
jgi:hypothetical protein